MEQPAVSHQLRILHDLRLVVGTRTGRSVRYGLHDSHVATLVDEALRGMERLAAKAPASEPTGQTYHGTESNSSLGRAPRPIERTP